MDEIGKKNQNWGKGPRLDMLTKRTWQKNSANTRHDLNINAKHIHSEVLTMDRVEILARFATGQF
ncbi:MAG: hypothetical protein IPI77_17230 [Saprospiraceae bacterium]|nr:hypothetical protein [Saprospiraceae bacterium]